MNGRLTIVLNIILLLCLIANSGCVGEKAGAVQSYKYVCSDGSIVSESRECRIEEPACSCNVPPLVCVCNQTTLGGVSNHSEPSLDKEPDNDAVNVSLPIKTEEQTGSGPCVSLGCPKDALFVGNNQTKKFHYCSCAQAEKISPRNRVCFSSAKYAVSLGYVPCGFCKPSDA